MLAGERPDAQLRGLVGSGPSQVGVSGAMRARDVSRPTAADEAAARATDAVRADRRPQRERS